MMFAARMQCSTLFRQLSTTSLASLHLNVVVDGGVSGRIVQNVALKSTKAFWEHIKWWCKINGKKVSKSTSTTQSVPLFVLYEMKQKNRQLSTKKILSAFQNIETSQILTEMMTNFNPLACLHFLINCGEDYSLTAEDTSKILRIFRQKASVDNLNTLKLLLTIRPQLLSCSTKDFNYIIQSCLERKSLADSFQWYDAMTNVLNVQPNDYTFAIMLPVFAELACWDQFFFLYNEMQSYGIIPSQKIMTTTLINATKHPHLHWQYYRQLVMDLQTNSQLSMNSPQVGIKHFIAPSTLCKVFEALLAANQPSELKELYMALVVHQCPLLSHNMVAEISAMSAIALGDIDFLQFIISNNSSQHALPSPLLNDSESALLHSNAIMQHTIGSENLPTSQQLSGIILQQALLISWVLSMSENGVAMKIWNNAMQISAHVEKQGKVHMLKAGSNVDSPVKITPSAAGPHIRTILANICTSMDLFYAMQSSHMVGVTIEDALATSVFSNAVHFINSVLFNERTKGTPISSPIIVSPKEFLLDSQLVDKLVRLFWLVNDSKSSAAIMSQCLQEGILVSEVAMSQVLQLLNHDGDSELALQLFDLYSTAASTHPMVDNAKPNVSTDTDNLSDIEATTSSLSKREVDSIKYALCYKYSPALFFDLIESLAELKQFDRIEQLICTDLPYRKGFLPTVAQIKRAMHALQFAGEYSKAVNVFNVSCGLYKENIHVYSSSSNPKKNTLENRINKKEIAKKLSASKKAAERTSYLSFLQSDSDGGDESDTGDGVEEVKSNDVEEEAFLASQKRLQQRRDSARVYMFEDDLHSEAFLVKLALQCCAKGRLGEDSVRIFSQCQDLQARGLPRPAAGDSSKLLQWVISALTTDTTVQLIPTFLDSLAELSPHPVIPDRKVLCTCLAAAVVVNRADILFLLIEEHMGKKQIPLEIFKEDELVEVVCSLMLPSQKSASELLDKERAREMIRSHVQLCGLQE